MLSIRHEHNEDIGVVYRVNAAAFPTETEARLVDSLRANGKAIVSLVAEEDGRVAGHILFSPVTVAGTDSCGIGLAPLAVLPAYRNRGIGARLVNEGLAACREAGYGFAVVLGEPEYYRRFGFTRASERGLDNEYGVDSPFMVLELHPGTLPPHGGMVKYAPEFADLGS